MMFRHRPNFDWWGYAGVGSRPAKLVATRAAIVLAAVLAGCSGAATESPGQSPISPASPDPVGWVGSVWVADEDAGSLTVLDAATNTVATTLTGLDVPHNVQVGNDDATVYVSNNGSNMVLAIDAATYQVTATAPTGPDPAHVIEAPNGKIYVANSGDGTVSVYQSRSLQPLGRIEVGGMPHGLRAAADGSVIVVANHSADALNLIDPRTDRVLGSVPVGAGPAQVAVLRVTDLAHGGVVAVEAGLGVN